MTAIRDVDVSRPLHPIEGLGDATGCMLILRWGRRVVGRCSAPVSGGGIALQDLTTVIEAAVTADAVDGWLHERIGYDERRVRAAVPLTATVAICTRERPDDLARALDAVASLARRPLEVIVIDNAPVTDATSRTVARHPFARYVREQRRGLDAARNRALREARGDIVAFSDDDAVPEPEWLDGLLASFQDPRVVAVTGLTLPLELETAAQELFEEHCTFARNYRRRVFDGQRDNPLTVAAAGAGVNMAMRRTAALALGGFDERLDCGMPTRSGGDHEFFSRILAAGHMMVYDPSAVTRHRHRRTMPELLDTVYGYGVGVYAMWTGLLLEQRELGVLKLGWEWLATTQLPRALRARDPLVRELARAELRGCVRGPGAWFAARRLKAQEA